MTVDDATLALIHELAAAGLKPLSEMTPAEARSFGGRLRERCGAGPDMASVDDVMIDTDSGLKVRILTPTMHPRATIIYYHGGGWVLGSIDEADAVGRHLAKSTNCVVILVDYRLAPEHPYPAAIQDAFAALEWALERDQSAGAARRPTIVMGDSAGGNLAAIVAQRARREALPITLQVLVCPVTDSDLNNSTYSDPANQLLLSRNSMIWFWDHYLPDINERALPSASPARALDLAGICPTVVLTAEFDVLREEGETYADLLRSAGVPVRHRRFASQMHGFFTLTNVLPGAADAMSFVAEEIEAHLAS